MRVAEPTTSNDLDTYQFMFIFRLTVYFQAIFIYIGQRVIYFSSTPRDYRTNLSLAIIGLIIHSLLLYLLIKGRQEAIEETSRQNLGQLF